jgi:hypothetical protein
MGVSITPSPGGKDRSFVILHDDERYFSSVNEFPQRFEPVVDQPEESPHR